DRFGLRDPEQATELDDTLVAELLVTVPSEPPVDIAKLVDGTGGDPAFVREIAQTFVSNATALLAEIRRCASEGDRTAVGRAAHSLKGASANMFAGPIHELCRDLEARARDFSDSELTQRIDRLAAELERVKIVLQSLDAESQGSRDRSAHQ